MSKKMKIWLPAIIMSAIAALLVIFYFYMLLANHPIRERDNGAGELFKTLGTIAVFCGAGSFAWFWFKTKLKSPSRAVRITRKLLLSTHKLLGWVTLILISLHGAYFLITKIHDNKVYSGLAGLVILLTIIGYGYFINKVRNKWMRVVHRSLGLLWVPILWLHAGGSALIAVGAVVAVGGVVIVLEKKAEQINNESPTRR